MKRLKTLIGKLKILIVARKKLSLAIAAGLIILITFVSAGSNKKSEYAFTTVIRQNLKQIVSVTGKIKAEREISLAFERSGTLLSLPVKVGDRMQRNALLAGLDDSELRSQLNQAEATLQRERVRLTELEQGTRPEEIQIYETKFTAAQINLAEAKTSALTALATVYGNAEDAIRNKINQVFDPPYSYYPLRLKFISIYPDTETKVRSQKVSIEYLLDNWKTSIQGLNNQSDLSVNLTSARGNLQTLKDFADTVSLLINAVSSSDANSSATIATWRTDIATGRSTINTSIASVNSINESLQSASSALQLARDELNLKRAGATIEQIQLQKLQVQQSQANRDTIAAQLNKTVLFAPMIGLITKVDFEIGEIVSPNAPVIHMISDNQYKIEVNVPEVEIAKIQLQNQATVTLDAYGESIDFDATVALIDPSETIIDGVPTYKTTLLFTREDERIKPGMTANITIVTMEKQNVLALPQRAIQRKDGKKYVQILGNAKQSNNRITEKREITTGIADTTGMIEILSGLEENQQVILP